MERCAIFIDGGYLQKLLAEYSNLAINFQKLSNLLADGCQILRTYYYNCAPFINPTQPTDEQRARHANMQRFFDKLQNLDRYDVRLGKLEYRGKDDKGKPIYVQKRVDILLGCDLVLLASKARISKAVLFTGDSDFIPAVEIAKNEGVEITICYGEEKGFIPHNSLLKIADERKPISKKHLDNIAYTK